MSTASNVVPLRHRAATRLGPKEARRLAIAAIPRICTARELLALFLRICDPRLGFTRSFKQVWLAEELGVTTETIRYSFRALERAGLAQITSGIGRTETVVTLNGDRLRELSVAHDLRNPLVNPPVHPGESTVHPGESGCPETPEVLGSEPKGSGVRPQNLPGPYARARDATRDHLEIPPNPPASRGAPSESCPTHGPGCARRACGRSPRQIEAEADRDMADRKRAAAQAAYRAEVEAARQAAAPASPELLADIRESIRKSRYRKKEEESE